MSEETREAKKKATKRIDAPGYRRQWRIGSVVRDRTTNTLYRVTGRPIRYHEDCPAVQTVVRARKLPDDWTACCRLMEIMEHVRQTGRHTPASRGAYGRPPEQVGEKPPLDGPRVSWEAKEDADSLASYPEILVQGDVVTYFRPIYDDSPVVTWIQDSALAEEVRTLIGAEPSLCRYPAVTVRG